MPDEPTPTPGGTGGEPATPEAPSSQLQSDAALLASLDKEGKETPSTPDPDAEFWKTAATKDFSKAPADIRAKIEAPFLSLSSKKVEEANQEKQRVLSLLEQAINRSQTGEQPITPNQAETLREKFDNGDYQGVIDLMKQSVLREVGPVLDYAMQERSVRQAASWRPELADPAVQNEVSEVLKQNPILVNYAAINNRELAPYLIAGATAQVLVPKLYAQIEAGKKEVEAAKRQAVEDYKAQLRGLPKSTSKAGSTPTAFPPERPMTLEEIKNKAWEDAGGH